MGTAKRSSLRAYAAAAAAVFALSGSAALGGGCPLPKQRPEAPLHATDLNGIAWPEFCFEQRELEEHFFIIGDWGGLFRGTIMPPIPANDGKREALDIVDEHAQHLVAEQMKIRANVSKPRYILNVGDNFYWGGVQTECGAAANQVLSSSIAQWEMVYENIYDGPLLGLPWMGVLGNHDYGGYKFTMGWDQAIAYTWGPSDRWLTPAQYWSTKVQYSDFSVDYLFVDTNMNDAFAPQDNPNHNMCSEANNPPNVSCGVTGPTSPSDCTMWFARLWAEQQPWMAERLSGSVADWRVVVTHFPPSFRREEWARIASQHRIDLIVTGHSHYQDVSNRDPRIGGAAWVISGGGGGITSESLPSEDGHDDQYGFFDVTISKFAIKLEAISHSGELRSTTVVSPRGWQNDATAARDESMPPVSTVTSTTTITLV